MANLFRVAEFATIQAYFAGDDCFSRTSRVSGVFGDWGLHAVVHLRLILSATKNWLITNPTIKRPKSMSVTWHGVFPAATTQFKSDQSLDLAATAAHLEKLIGAGVHGLIMLGTVGENCSLEYAEKLEVLQAAVRQADRRVPVLTGVAECTTALACRFAADAQKAGVDGLMVLPAMVYKSDPRETMAHFRAVAKASDLPIMCYNNPVSYGVDITPAMFAELADEPKFVAIKESSENVRRITDLANTLRRPLPASLRRRRPGAGERGARRGRAGCRAW